MAPAYLISIASLRITYVYFKSTNGLLPSKNPVKLIQFVKGCLANWCPRYQLSISSWVKSMQLGESNWKRTMKWLWWLNWRNSNRWDEVVQTSAGCYPPHLHLLSYFWPRSARRPPPPLCQTDALPLQRKHNNNNSVAVTKESIHPSIHPVVSSGQFERMAGSDTSHTHKKKKKKKKKSCNNYDDDVQISQINCESGWTFGGFSVNSGLITPHFVLIECSWLVTELFGQLLVDSLLVFVLLFALMDFGKSWHCAYRWHTSKQPPKWLCLLRHRVKKKQNRKSKKKKN